MCIFEYDKEEDRKLQKAEYEAGKEAGKKETAVVMNKMKFPVEKIAEVLQVDKDMIVKWIEDK